ncbi:MAG: hypothetical protein WDW36_009486 [Sanguina aurantia]
MGQDQGANFPAGFPAEAPEGAPALQAHGQRGAGEQGSREGAGWASPADGGDAAGAALPGARQAMWAHACVRHVVVWECPNGCLSVALFTRAQLDASSQRGAADQGGSASHADPGPPKRKRGRPSTKNKPSSEQQRTGDLEDERGAASPTAKVSGGNDETGLPLRDPEADVEPIKRKAGRPPASLNRTNKSEKKVQPGKTPKAAKVEKGREGAGRGKAAAAAAAAAAADEGGAGSEEEEDVERDDRAEEHAAAGGGGSKGAGGRVFPSGGRARGSGEEGGSHLDVAGAGP